MARPPVKDERREQILDGLFAAMATSGARGASISEIADAAGIARGALHYYFSSKEEIRQALMERLGKRYLDGLARYLDALDQRGASAERLVQGLVRFHFGGDEDETERLLAVWIDFWGSAPSDGELRAVVFRVQEGARALCARVLCRVRPELAALPAAELRTRASTVLALIEGALLQWRIAQPIEPFAREALRAALTDAALSIILGGADPRADHRGRPEHSSSQPARAAPDDDDPFTESHLDVRNA